MNHFDNCEDDGEAMRPLAFYVHRLLKQIDPGAPGAEAECHELHSAGRVGGGEAASVVSLRICKEPAAIDRELGTIFEPFDCSVYLGRRLLGRYSRIGAGRISAFDSRGLWLGDFRKQGDARRAICRRGRPQQSAADR